MLLVFESQLNPLGRSFSRSAYRRGQVLIEKVLTIPDMTHDTLVILFFH